MIEAFAWGVAFMHFTCGVTFFAIGCKRRERPSIWISFIAIVFWPLMVQHLMDRAALPPSDQDTQTVHRGTE